MFQITTMASLFYAVLINVILGLQLVYSCRPATPITRATAHETFSKASIVIVGTLIKYYNGEPLGPHPPYSSKHVIVDVDCTVKSPIAIGETATLNGNDMWHSCFHSELTQNKTYVIAANWNETDPEGFIRVYEVNVASVGTYEPNTENLGAAYSYCDDNVKGDAPRCACNYTTEPSNDDTTDPSNDDTASPNPLSAGHRNTQTPFSLLLASILVGWILMRMRMK